MASLIANAAGAKATPEDFIPGARKAKRKQTPQEMYEFIEAMNQHLNEVN